MVFRCMCVCVCVSLLLYPFICWWTLRLLLFPMVNNAMNIGLHVFFQMLFLFSMNMYLGAELLDHIVVLFLVFWGTFILFSIVAVTIYIPTNSAWEFLFFFFFPISSSTFVICGLSDNSHSDRYEVILSCDFWVHFSDD